MWYTSVKTPMPLAKIRSISHSTASSSIFRAKIPLRGLVIDGREKLLDVDLEHVAKASSQGLSPVQGAVGAFAHPIGVAVVNKAAFEPRLDQIAQGVMGPRDP